jgi:hypothetical protein
MLAFGWEIPGGFRCSFGLEGLSWVTGKFSAAAPSTGSVFFSEGTGRHE